MHWRDCAAVKVTREQSNLTCKVGMSTSWITTCHIVRLWSSCVVVMIIDDIYIWDTVGPL